MGHLVAKFPNTHFCDALPARGLDDSVFRLAKVIKAALDEEIDGERKSGNAVGEDAIVDVAAGGVVASERGGLLPGFPSATRVLIVAIRKRLVSRYPKALYQEKGEEHRRDALREVEVEAAKARESMSHQSDKKPIPV